MTASPIELLSNAATRLSTHLTLARFYENCQCPTCDALREVNKAYGEIKEASLLLRQGPSAAERAEAASRQMANGERPLALALQVERGGTRYNLYFEGDLVMTKWLPEVVAYATHKQWDLHFMRRT